MSDSKARPKSKILQAIGQRSNTVQMLVLLLALAGAWGLLLGLFMLPEGLAGDLSDAHELDLIFNLLFGVLVLAVAGVLLNGKVLALWLFIGVLLIIAAFNYFLGCDFNLLIALFGAVIVWRMFMAQRRGELQ